MGNQTGDLLRYCSVVDAHNEGITVLQAYYDKQIAGLLLRKVFVTAVILKKALYPGATLLDQGQAKSTVHLPVISIDLFKS